MRDFIEKYSLYIGLVLMVLILISGTLLMMKKGVFANEKNDYSSQIETLKSQVEKLGAENQKLESAPCDCQNSSAENQTSNQTSGLININTAGQSELESLPGIGPTYAKRIIEYRNSNGAFTSKEQLKNIKGIGEKTYLKFKDLIAI